MKKIILIAKKEFLDILRDRRTLIRMILIPLLVFPLIMNIVTRVQSSQSQKQAEKELTIGYILNGQSVEGIDRMRQTPNYTFVEFADTNTLMASIISDSTDMGIYYTPTFNADYDSGLQAKYVLFYRAADGEDYDRFKEVLNREDSVLTAQRMQQIGKPYEYVEPTSRRMSNLSTLEEILGKYAGGILPYIFMAFLFMGCMLPAIDLFAGEKERGTIETLLTSPVNRSQILLGKFIVVVCFGLMSASVALAGLFISLNMLEADGELMAAINQILSPTLIGTLYVLLVPLAFFFAGVMIPISVYARSFKEAQSILTPLNIVMVLPAMAGFFPGVELDYTTAFIPIVNVVLACKAIIAGNADGVLLAITFVTLIVLAAISLLIALRQFGKETSILR
ncbi:MAG: ABC transporter permease [Crocinitomicaceae bacterium]|nr:ABC transporter permease [Crocinitomicaceae bacterium]